MVEGDRKDPAVFVLSKDAKCDACEKPIRKGYFIKSDHSSGTRTGSCMDCAGLGPTVFLRSGDAKATRLASKYSNGRHAVVKWSRSRKRFERLGFLLDKEAVRRAFEELEIPTDGFDDQEDDCRGDWMSKVDSDELSDNGGD